MNRKRVQENPTMIKWALKLIEIQMHFGFTEYKSNKAVKIKSPYMLKTSEKLA